MRNALLGLLVGGGIGLLLAGGRGLAQTAYSSAGDAVAGKRLFRSADWTATGLTCLHCHADFNEKKNRDDYMRPGHPLYNSGNRAEWHAWDGVLDTLQVVYSLEEAVSACMERWMTERDEQGVGMPPVKHRLRQVAAYLRTEALSPEKKSKPITFIWDGKIPGDRLLKAGNAALGRGVYLRSCAICHKEDGSGPAPSLIRNGYSHYQITKKVRGIDNPGLDGLVMPRFSKDRLSDRALINVAAYVYQM